MTIPLAVYRELAATDLLRVLLSLGWIKVEPAELLPDEALRQNTVFQNLGAGEQTCVLLARQQPDSVLLMSDNKARQFARTLGLPTVNIPAFLLACKLAGLVNPVQMAHIVEDLKNKDFYEFNPEVRESLLR